GCPLASPRSGEVAPLAKRAGRVGVAETPHASEEMGSPPSPPHAVGRSPRSRSEPGGWGSLRYLALRLRPTIAAVTSGGTPSVDPRGGTARRAGPAPNR